MAPSPGRLVGSESLVLLGSPEQRLGKGALRMAAAEARKEAEESARKMAGRAARSATAKVGRFFAEHGQRQALQTLSRIPQRTLMNLAKTVPAKAEAHVLEHTREIAGKVVHSLFSKGTSIDAVVDLARTALRAGARPVLSVTDSGALAFVFEHEFPNAIGAKGEKVLRLVVDAEGSLVTAFPVAAERKLATLTVRGVAVVASVAPLLLLSALAESDSELASSDAARRSAKANEPSWTERILEFLGPYGVLESSPIAIEPNFVAIRDRTRAALEEARTSFGRELRPAERQAVEQCIYNVWADAAAGANG